MKNIFSCSRGLLVLSSAWLLLAGFASAQTWNLAWSDEFNGALNSPIDSTKWQFDTGILNVNDEVEYYCAPGRSTSPCSAGTPNAYIDGNGHLVIQAIYINPSVAPYSGSWTSARLNTANNLASFKYGRIESSMQLPIGPGLWPAFWALGTDITTVGWPTSGETDYMENVPASSGLGPTEIKSTIHGTGYSGANGLGQSYTFPGGGQVNTAFHTYGAIWSPNMIQFYVDAPSNVFFVRTASDIPAGTQWPFNANFFLLLNLAVGGTGSWPGPPDGSTPNPALMVVDYVRAYTPSSVAGPTMSGTSLNLTAGQPGQSTVTLNSTAGTGRVYLSCSTNAPKASCSIASTDSLNPYTVDFSNSAAGSATVSVTTTANTAGLIGVQKSFKVASALGGTLVVFGLVLLPAGAMRKLRRGIAGTGLLCVLMMFPNCGGTSGGGGGGGGGGGTTPGSYSITVNAYTVSNTSGTPDSTGNISLKVN
ncbi:MAG: glycoside hydrolase family 16 protein [Terriglobales bacterium]